MLRNTVLFKEISLEKKKNKRQQKTKMMGFLNKLFIQGNNFCAALSSQILQNISLFFAVRGFE